MRRVLFESKLNEYGELLTVAELGEFLRVGRTTAYKLVKDGVIPSKKFGKQIRIFKKDILAYMAK